MDISMQQGGKLQKKKQLTVKSKQDKQQKQKQEVQSKKKADNSSSKSKVSKKGGALIQDVQNLAVPFAILLAKEGLSKMFKDEKKASLSSKTSSKTASKTSSLRRRSTMNGGSCNLGCAAQTGGQAAKQLFELQKEIDSFLEKY